MPARFSRLTSDADSRSAADSQSALDHSNPIDSRTSKDVRLPANRYVLFLLITGLGLAADLWTKSYFFQHHFQPDLLAAGKPQPVHWWIDGVLGVQCHTNPGALFGFGKGYSFYFAIVSIVALMGIVVWLFWFKQAIDRWLTFSLGMISAGILGNMYDRFGLGYKPEYPVEIRDNVRDWIYFYLQGVRGFQPWPNFNIADSLLVTGAFLIFLHAIFVKDEAAASRPLKT